MGNQIIGKPWAHSISDIQTLELSCVRISCCTLSFSDTENDCGLQQAETSQMAHAPYWANCIRL